MAKRSANSATYLPIVGVLAWLVPGLGHLYIGDKRRGLVLMVTIVATFWCGVMMGGTRGTVDAGKRNLWFMAQIGAGGNALIGWGLHEWTGVAGWKTSRETGVRYKIRKQPGHWLGLDVGIHYTGVAGLLNLLAILDALARADRPPRRDEREAAIAGKRAGAKS